MSFISSAELVILRKMYPEGCRVSLERMVDEPYAKLHPGDLGTVRNVDDAGQIHISWDQGSSVAVIYKVDSCNCLMTKEQMDETLAQMKRIPFENMDRLQAWMEEKLLPVFPKLFFRPAINGELLVEMGCSAFTLKNARITVGFTQDAQVFQYVTAAGCTAAVEKQAWDLVIFLRLIYKFFQFFLIVSFIQQYYYILSASSQMLFIIF